MDDNYYVDDSNSASSGKVRLEHIISFSDAIFAFSITFMAISIQIPNFAKNGAIQQEVISALLQLRPQLETYALSFMIRCILDFISSCI